MKITNRKRVNNVTVFLCIMAAGAAAVGRGDEAAAQTGGAFHLEKRREAGIIAGGALLLAAGSLIHFNQQGPVPDRLEREHIFPPDRFAVEMHIAGTGKASDITAGFCLALPLLTAFGSGTGSSLQEDLVMALESALVTQGLIELSKSLFQRPRPYAYRESGTKPLGSNAGRSFFSGHTAAAFQGAVCAAVVFGERNPDSPLRVPVWVAGLACAAATAVLRVTSGNHFPTDVIAGAAVGSFVGWLIPRLHRRPGAPNMFPSGPGMLNFSINF